MNPIYTATAHSTGDGRNGHVTSDDVEGTQVSASIGIGPLDDGGFGLKADLVVYAPKLDRATAQSLVEAAHKVCPYSNATRGNIEVGLSVVE
jgi:osmotically inducible protein OsmC